MPNRWTLQQRRVALAWIDMNWDNPTADQFYQMQTSAQVEKVIRLLVQNTTEVDINDFKLPFDRGQGQQVAESSPMTMEQATAIAMRKWFAIAKYQGT